MQKTYRVHVDVTVEDLSEEAVRLFVQERVIDDSNPDNLNSQVILITVLDHAEEIHHIQYADALPINKLRAISAYCGNFVWDCLKEGEEQARWFSGMFATEDALRVVAEWEKGMDEQEDDDWRQFITNTYQEYLQGSTKCDGREENPDRDAVSDEARG